MIVSRSVVESIRPTDDEDGPFDCRRGANITAIEPDVNFLSRERIEAKYFRDAILAAIANEKPPILETVNEPTNAGLSGLAYPGAAIVASTLAVAGRRRKNAKLESTR